MDKKITIGEKYLKDMVYGSIDGIITTFAVVSGVVGASLSSSIIIILGLANLFADGISMAIGNYLSTKSEIEKMEKSRKRHREDIKNNPEKEKKSIEIILNKSKLSESTKTLLIKEITENKEAWEDVLITSEYGDKIYDINPRKTAFATFLSFVVAGFIPILAFVLAATTGVFQDNSFQVAIILTAIALFSVGVIKARLVNKGVLRSGIETLLIGGLAALVAFGVGYLLKSLVGN